MSNTQTDTWVAHSAVLLGRRMVCVILEDSGEKKRRRDGRPGCEQQRPPCVYFKHLVMNANVPVLNNITYKLYVVSTKIKDKLLQKLCI